MPLTFARQGERVLIRKVGGKAATRQFLEHLGFVPGSVITVVNELGGSLIVQVKEARVAVSREMAAKIMI